MFDLPDGGLKAATAVVLAAAFVFAGVMHFLRPRMFEAIVPPSLPAPRALVLISGAAEILGGLGLLVAPVRALAGWGLVALLLAVFPANIFMAQRAERFHKIAPRWALWARLPLQFVLIGLVLWVSQ